MTPTYTKNKILQREAIESFIMTTKRSLGQLTYLRIWHDNSASVVTKSSWFLKLAILHDLQTREKFYFICNDWLALDQSDGQIERLLPVATQQQRTEMKYLI